MRTTKRFFFQSTVFWNEAGCVGGEWVVGVYTRNAAARKSHALLFVACRKTSIGDRCTAYYARHISRDDEIGEGEGVCRFPVLQGLYQNYHKLQYIAFGVSYRLEYRSYFHKMVNPGGPRVKRSIRRQGSRKLTRDKSE